MKGKKIFIFIVVIWLGCSWEIDLVPCLTDNCTICDVTQTTCTSCADGFFLDDANSACSSCDTQIFNCVNCTLDSSTSVVTCDNCGGN